MSNEFIRTIFHADPELEFCDLFNGMSPLWNYNLHHHACIELIYRQSGHGKTDLLEGTQNFTFFDTLVYPVNCWHQDKFAASEENEAYCLWINMPEVALEKSLHVQDRNGKLGNLFHAIYEEYKKEHAPQEIISLMIRTLLIQTLLFSEEAAPSMIDRVVQYLHARMHEKITLDQLSNISFLSKSSLSKQFKQETGETIIKYLNNIRIERAKMLLITTPKTINEIGYSVGFDSPKYFLRIFKALTGTTPATFRKCKGANEAKEPASGK